LASLAFFVVSLVNLVIVRIGVFLIVALALFY